MLSYLHVKILLETVGEKYCNLDIVEVDRKWGTEPLLRNCPNVSFEDQDGKIASVWKRQLKSLACTDSSLLKDRCSSDPKHVWARFPVIFDWEFPLLPIFFGRNPGGAATSEEYRFHPDVKSNQRPIGLGLLRSLNHFWLRWLGPPPVFSSVRYWYNSFFIRRKRAQASDWATDCIWVSMS